MFSNLGFHFGDKQREQRLPSSRHSTIGIYDRQVEGDYRTVHLVQGPDGYGFLLSARTGGKFKPTPANPSMHFFEAVKNGGVAMYAGIRAGDYLLRVNGHDVRTSSHKRVVKMISESKNSVTLDITEAKQVFTGAQSEYNYGTQPERMKLERLDRLNSVPNDLAHAIERMYLNAPPWKEMTIRPRQNASRRANLYEMKRMINDDIEYSAEDLPLPSHYKLYSSMPSGIPSYSYDLADRPKTLIPRAVLRHKNSSEREFMSSSTSHSIVSETFYEEEELPPAPVPKQDQAIGMPSNSMKMKGIPETITKERVEFHPQMEISNRPPVIQPPKSTADLQRKKNETSSSQGVGFEEELRNAVARRGNRIKRGT